MNTIFCASFALLTSIYSIPTFAQSLKFDSDISEDLKAQVNADLDALGSLELDTSSPLNTLIFGEYTDYQEWLFSRIQSLGIGENGPIAVAYYNDAWPNKMWVTKNYLTLSIPMIYRVSTFLHEARHTEAKHSTHASCPSPYRLTNGDPVMSYYTHAELAGKPYCDQNAEDAYGVEAVFYRNIARYCVNCNDKVKADAQIQFEESLKRIVDMDEHQRLMLDSDFSDWLVDLGQNDQL